MNVFWEKECLVFSGLTKPQKMLWLSKLLFFLSMFARETYQVGTDAVNSPETLRAFNELIHRVSSRQLDIALEKTAAMPDKQFFLMLGDAVNELEINTEVLLKQIDRL